MTLRIFNTLSRQLEVFEPIEPNHVRMYVCGMTIYDLCHVGHARFLMAFDIVYRWLQQLGYRVTYVRNITDIDDKIIRRALERGIPIASVDRGDDGGDAPGHRRAGHARAARTNRAPPPTCRRCSR